MAINDIFKGFYTNLYKAETYFEEPICKQYLDKLELPRISQMDKESLEAPLSLEELHVSLKSLQKGKSPGLDGLPPELYLEIWDLVGILMLNSFNFAIEHGVFHRDQKTSLISLLLKKGKDPLDCSSYRPISLIPCDVKIYAKVFASRMEKVIHSLIKEDQTGFIKGRNASDNMRRLLHILDFADSHPTPCAVFSLDVEKAFDRLEWNYMYYMCINTTPYKHNTLYHTSAWHDHVHIHSALTQPLRPYSAHRHEGHTRTQARTRPLISYSFEHHTQRAALATHTHLWVH